MTQQERDRRIAWKQEQIAKFEAQGYVLSEHWRWIHDKEAYKAVIETRQAIRLTTFEHDMAIGTISHDYLMRQRMIIPHTEQSLELTIPHQDWQEPYVQGAKPRTQASKPRRIRSSEREI